MPELERTPDQEDAVEHYARSATLILIFAVMILGFACFGATLLGLIWLIIGPNPF